MEKSNEGSTKKDEILIVGDSHAHSEKLRTLLEDHGFAVSAVENGKQAVDYLKKRKPSIIVSDIIMPEMDGWQLCQYVKKHVSLRDIPFVALTPFSDPIDVIQGLKSGADHFVAKPYDDDVLISRIKHVLINQDIRQNSLSAKTTEVYFGGQKHRVSFDHHQTLDLLLSTFETAVQKNRELEAALARLKDAEELLSRQVVELQNIAIHDALTGLLNRRGFFILIEQQMKLAARMKGKTYVFYIDVDGMKWINDTLGHDEGDNALVATAKFLIENSRKSDIVARLGGDEFVLVAIDALEESQQLIISRMLRNLEKFNSKMTRGYKLSLSIGVALYDVEKPCSIDELLSRADRLMYEQKNRKKTQSKQN
ncbi:MAG: diguanylate cyclase [Dehalococcoidia bacterium]|jgi:diguanylate cyclase (GGDEF)-like protein